MSILIKPIITEKATNDSEVNNRYSFIVAKKANKLEIKSAVQSAYGVSIESVKTLNYPVQKSTKYTKKGLVTGVKGGFKKAIVQLAEGESIDFYNNL
ncbi:50S ribosomal protein L23 [Polaribacter sp. BAL334]|jgi:large subunit ribosomal protein L23|uniref:50S ribosomal protein L23 n=1 Tax=Polaribacter sp. BAL334 TaxID=1708178 RepID=UPI0018D24955|nr:50S ribosomal protein L23 [Polaribacter sp. BAL334]MBG7613557.1 50S ribosomal protein L23 [Polaribacter sp. BAL334]